MLYLLKYSKKGSQINQTFLWSVTKEVLDLILAGYLLHYICSSFLWTKMSKDHYKKTEAVLALETLFSLPTYSILFDWKFIRELVSEVVELLASE